MTAASDLRHLAEQSTPGPWEVSPDLLPVGFADSVTIDSPMYEIANTGPDDAALIVWLANRRDPIAALIEWAEDAPHTDTCRMTRAFNLKCTCGRDDALDALEATRPESGQP